jgi:nucleoside-diphosphate-sugar epimerase
VARKTALVTGSEGFIGRHTVEALEKQGWVVADWDIKSNRDCREIFKTSTQHFDLVVHCAAIVGGRETIEGDPLAVAQNLAIDSDMFRWAARSRPGRVIYWSSSAVYPVKLQTGGYFAGLHEFDVDLDNPRLPDQTYGWAKLTGEYLADYLRAEGVAVTVLRPFSGYGEDQDASYPFPALAARALRREDPFTVWGSGQQVRDWVHVDDVVATALKCAHDDIDGPLNIGTGRGTNFLDLAEMFCDAVGYSPTIATWPDKPAGVMRRVCSPDALFTVRKPRVTLEEGIERITRRMI